VPKFYRDAQDFDCLQLGADELGRHLIHRRFLEGSSPLRDEVENRSLRELQGWKVSILTFLADNNGCHIGDMAAALTKTSNSAGWGPYVYDNALAETIIGLYKTELIHRHGPWRHLDAVEYATLEWVDWFNHHRLLEPIGNVPPAELEAKYHHQPTSQLPMAA